ncbi:MAG: cyclic nucleotide-binding domain-containing protein [Parvularculaceae bacterium]|nr:cyclic nucleotide-binding domain-containing protein [Parvularculaceae bacterium]
MSNPADQPAIAQTLLSEAAIFSDLPKAIIAAVAGAASVRRIEAGETIFAHGQFDGSELIFVADGRLRSTQADERTGSMMVESIGSGSFFALALAVVSPDLTRFSNVTIAAETDATVVFIDTEAFRNLVAQRPLLTRALLLHFARVSIGAGAGAASEAGPDRRVFAAIAGLVRRDAVAATWRIDRMPKHRDLADLANVAEGDAANAVARLISTGVAKRDYPGLVIEDMAQLNRLAR